MISDSSVVKLQRTQTIAFGFSSVTYGLFVLESPSSFREGAERAPSAQAPSFGVSAKRCIDERNGQGNRRQRDQRSKQLTAKK